MKVLGSKQSKQFVYEVINRTVFKIVKKVTPLNYHEHIYFNFKGVNYLKNEDIPLFNKEDRLNPSLIDVFPIKYEALKLHSSSRHYVIVLVKGSVFRIPTDSKDKPIFYTDNNEAYPSTLVDYYIGNVININEDRVG